MNRRRIAAISTSTWDAWINNCASEEIIDWVSLLLQARVLLQTWLRVHWYLHL